MEEWRRSNKYDNYELSSEGRVRNANTGRILKTNVNIRGGYEQVTLRKDGKTRTERIRNLVAETFLGPNPGMDVRSKNGDILNSRADNLEYCTRSQTIQRAYDRGSKSSTNTIKRVRIIETGEVFESIQECARYLGVTPSSVGKCASRATFSCCGYHITYAD